MASPPDQSQDEVNPPQDPELLRHRAASDNGRVDLGVRQGFLTLDLNTAVTVPTLAWSGARPGKCYQNVNRFVMERGGGFASGWALADSGPIVRNDVTGMPSSTAEYRRKWRIDARKAGVPDIVKSRDSVPPAMLVGGPDRASVSPHISLTDIHRSLRTRRRQPSALSFIADGEITSPSCGTAKDA